MPAEIESQRKAKRRKLVDESSITEIKSIDDLRRLLKFQPDFQLESKAAIQRFKQFLAGITGLDDDAARVRSLEILRAYSEDEISLNQEAAPLSGLISLWSSAVDTNDESILSSVPSVLALFLKTISSYLEFRTLGLSLCNRLLLKDKLRLFDRGLTATKTKEHLISPCLRLLTEIVNFDGGEVASLVYSKRETTFRRLEVFLDQRNPSIRSEDVQLKPTLRRIAQRFLLANLKFQSVSAKGDIIAQGRTIRACLQNLKNDRPDIVTDILVSLEKDVVRASALAKGIKGRLFDNSNLSLLSSLYKFQEPASDPASGGSVRAQVDILLRLICTQPESGVLLPQNGWYPAGSNPEKSLKSSADSNTIESNADSSFNSGYRDKSVPKNGVLSTFIQALRPDMDTLQASLLLDTFRAAPELVADYFAKKSSFIAEPKDTPAWLGQSAFFFSVIQLPVPKYCGWRDGYAALPPPSSTVIESILPRPLDRANTTRSLNLNHEVITLFAVRAVTVAFQKLSKVLEVYGTPTSNLGSWKQASSDLISAFSQRCPSARDVLSTLQRTPKSDEKLRGSIIELLSKYYQVLPRLMLLEKFDASLALMDTISRVEKGEEEQSLKYVRFSELENLLKIAQISPDTKWWHKPGRSPRLESLAGTDVNQIHHTTLHSL
jgi:nucleolar pre-ribosomal-associated protein 1